MSEVILLLELRCILEGSGNINALAIFTFPNRLDPARAAGNPGSAARKSGRTKSGGLNQEFLQPRTVSWSVWPATLAKGLLFLPRIHIYRRPHQTYESTSSVLERYRRPAKHKADSLFFHRVKV